jgi:hypothetical protein
MKSGRRDAARNSEFQVERLLAFAAAAGRSAAIVPPEVTA